MALKNVISQRRHSPRTPLRAHHWEDALRSAQLLATYYLIPDFISYGAYHWGRGGLETGDYMLGTFRAHVHLSHNVTGG